MKNKKIPTIVALILLMAGVFLGVVFINIKTDFLPRASQESQPKDIKLVNLTPTAFSVVWTTSAQASGYIKYGLEASKLTLVVQDERDQLSGSVNEFKNHLVNLVNLEPGKSYYFRIGSGSQLYDNNGQAFVVTTPAQSATDPVSDMIFGNVVNAASNPTEDAIVYVSVPNGVTQAGLVKENGNWAVNLGKTWDQTSKSYLNYDKANSDLSIIVIDKDGVKTQISTPISNARPVPTITLGKDESFQSNRSATTKTDSQTNEVVETDPAIPPQEEDAAPAAEVEPGAPTEPVSDSDSDSADNSEIISKLSIQPLDIADNQPGSPITISTIPKDGTVITETMPEFTGKAPKGVAITISVHSSQAYTATVTTDSSGNWTWTPDGSLEPGEHTISISYLDPVSGKLNVVSKDFVIASAEVEGVPSYQATPSASTKPSPTLRPRTEVATTSAVPTAGSVSMTWLSLLFGLIFIGGGMSFVVYSKQSNH